MVRKASAGSIWDVFSKTLSIPTLLAPFLLLSSTKYEINNRSPAPFPPSQKYFKTLPINLEIFQPHLAIIIFPARMSKRRVFFRDYETNWEAERKQSHKHLKPSWYHNDCLYDVFGALLPLGVGSVQLALSPVSMSPMSPMFPCILLHPS